MKHWIVGLVVGLSAAASFADELSGMRITGALGKQLALYADSEGRSKLREIPSADVAKMNLVIRREAGDFVEVSIDSQNVWLDAERIRLDRKAPGCIRIANTKDIQVAGTRGASDQKDCK